MGKVELRDGEKHVLKPNTLLGFLVICINASSFFLDSVWIGFSFTCMRKCPN